MKNMLLALLSILFLVAGCDSDKNKIELIDDDNSIYLAISQVDKQPSYAGTIALTNELREIFEKYYDVKYTLNEPILFGYNYYVNENGRIQKMKRSKSGGMFGLNLPEDYSKVIEPEILKKFESVVFEPAIKDAKKVKFQSLMMMMIFRNKENKIESIIYLGFGDQPDSRLEKMYLNAGADFMISVDNPPEIVGGMEALQKKVHYPEIAKKKKLQGKVLIKAFIDEKGKVVKTEIIKGTGSILDTAAANALLNTKFIPGKQAGVQVRTQIAVPILFKLK